VEAGSAAYREKRSAVFAATKSMLEYEARIPALVQEHRRRVSSRVIYGTAGLALAGMLAAAAVIVVGSATRWYLIPVAVVGLVAVVMVAAEHRAEVSGHRSRMAGAIVLLLAAGLVAVVMGRLISAFWLGLLLIAVPAVGVCWLIDDAKEAS